VTKKKVFIALTPGSRAVNAERTAIENLEKYQNTYGTYCGKIGFLPYELRQVGIKDVALIYVKT
jgi:hypothetical protein